MDGNYYPNPHGRPVPQPPHQQHVMQQQQQQSHAQHNMQGYMQQPYTTFPEPQHYSPTETSFSSENYRADSHQTINVSSNDIYTSTLRRKGTVKNVQLRGGKLVLDVPVPDKVLALGKYRDSPEVTHMRYNEDEKLFTKSMTAVQKNIAYMCSKENSSTWGPDGWKKIVVCIVSDGRSKINERVQNVLGLMGCYQDGIMKRTVNGKEVSSHIFEYTTQVNVDPDLRIRGSDAGFVPVQVLFCLKEQNAKKINSHRWFFNAFGRVLNPNVCVLIDVGTKPSGTSIYQLWKAFDQNPRIGGACGEIYTETGSGCHKLINPLVAAQNFEYKMSNILDKPLESVFGFISVLPGAFSAYRYAALRDTEPGKGPLSAYFLGEKMHGGANIFAANMYLAEDRVLCFELVTKRKERWVLHYVKSAKAETDVPDAVPEFISQRRRWLNGSFFANVHALLHFWQIFRSGHSFGRKLALLFEFLYSFINLVFSWFALSTFYLVFFFLGQQLSCKKDDVECKTDPFTFNGQHYGYIVTQVLQWLYIVAIIIIFICSLGNRPQGSKYTYTSLMVLFAIIMGMMVFMSIYTIVITIQTQAADGFVFSDLWADPGFRDIVISILATYGLYFISSLLYWEPWHMFTSIIQYLLLLPSFVNILMVYAFCNLHDVTWGTKGDNKAEKLGKVVTTTDASGNQVAQIELLTDQQDINAEYDRLLQLLRSPPPKEKKVVDEETKKQDYFRSFRTRVLLFWVLCNMALIAGLTNPATLAYFEFLGQSRGVVGFNPYLTFIFYSVVIISLIRFLGSTWYLIDRAIWG